jgi:hypothetical protein
VNVQYVGENGIHNVLGGGSQLSQICIDFTIVRDQWFVNERIGYIRLKLEAGSEGWMRHE